MTASRPLDQLRPVKFELDYVMYPEGSVLISMGNTRVLCNATVEESLPRWLHNSKLKQGWVTAEYSMLPRATAERTSRERNGPGGRTHEIQRLIGRSLRAAMGTFAFGEYTIKVDCDVLTADGGTRCASITGACVALHDACTWLSEKTGQPSPFGRLVAAISVGTVDGEQRLDLAYLEDRDAEVDANVVMLAPHDFVEVQGTGEHGTFDRAALDRLLDLAQGGLNELFALQRTALGL